MAFILRPVKNILGHLFSSYLGHKFNCHLQFFLIIFFLKKKILNIHLQHESTHTGRRVIKMFTVLHLIFVKQTVSWFKVPLLWDFSQHAAFDKCAIWWGEQGLQCRNTNFWKVFHYHHIRHVEAYSWRLTHHSCYKLKKSCDKDFFFQKLWIEENSAS